MARDDWYRRTTWSSSDAEDFFEGLARSRGAFHKAQYLRIQALHLQESGLYREALHLLDILCADFSGESSQLTVALLQKAECLWAVNNGAGAFDTYLEALAAQRRHPGFRSSVALSFAERFHDYDNGAYRRMLVNELNDELAHAALFLAGVRVQYGAIMARLLTDLGGCRGFGTA